MGNISELDSSSGKVDMSGQTDATIHLSHVLEFTLVTSMEFVLILESGISTEIYAIVVASLLLFSIFCAWLMTDDAAECYIELHDCTTELCKARVKYVCILRFISLKCLSTHLSRPTVILIKEIRETTSLFFYAIY